jgi:hypothetical protein
MSSATPLFAADGEIHFYIVDGRRIGNLCPRLTHDEAAAKNEQLAAHLCHGRWVLASGFTPKPAVARRFKYTKKKGGQ